MQYNNIMYSVLSNLPPVLTGTSFSDYVTEHIFQPLGMNASYHYSEAHASGHLAEGFARRDLNLTEDLFGRGIPQGLPYPGWDHPSGSCKRESLGAPAVNV